MGGNGTVEVVTAARGSEGRLDVLVRGEGGKGGEVRADWTRGSHVQGRLDLIYGADWI